MSGLTKKQIHTDATLARVVGLEEGTLISYAELTKAIHEYIKRNKLKKVEQEKDSISSTQPLQQINYCHSCGAPHFATAVFCDRCGAKQ